MPALAMFVLVGVLTGLWLPIPGGIYPAWCMIIMGSLLWWLGGLKLLLGVIAFTSAAIACHDYRARILVDELAGQDILVTGIVSDFPRRTEQGWVLQLDIRQDYTLVPQPERIQLSIFADTPQPQAGELWQLKVRLKPPFGFINRAGFDRAMRLLVHRTHAAGYVRPSPLNKKLRGVSPEAGILMFRAYLRGHLESLLADSQMLPLILGITVGARDLISGSQWHLFRVTGTSHLMAISGLHIGMIALAIWYASFLPAWIAGVLGWTLSTRYFPCCLAAAGSTGYAMLAGFTIPTIRALIMVLVVLILSSSHRPVNRIWVLSFTLIVVTLSDPLAVLSASFWLSFVAVALLFVFLRPSSSGEGMKRGYCIYVFRRISQMIKAQLILGCGLVLPMCLFFSQVSLIAPVANLIAVPVFTILVLPAALTGVMLSLVATPVALASLQFAVRSLEVLLQFLQWLSQSSLSIWHAGPASIGFLLLTGVGCLLLLLPQPMKAPWVGLLLIVFGVGVNQGNQPARVTVNVMDVGQGLAVLIQIPGHTLLYDTGPSWPGGDAGLQVVVPVLQRLGIEKIDLLVISHSDNDHLGGAASVIEAIDIARIAGPPELTLTGKNITLCKTGIQWNWEGVIFEFIHPRTHNGWSDNNASCVLQLSVAQHSLLLTGDIEATAEIVLLGRDELEPADLVIAPHHGSVTSSSQALVNYLSPTYVVFPVGYKNRWGFPAPKIVQRWENAGTCGLTTSTTGALEFVYKQDRGFVLTQITAASWRRPWAVRLLSLPDCIQSVATVNGTSTGL
ncbi:MAG: DNA internalization-related competence protein ComEC/Rec2 [Gammaproteobacteria bacterium]|nr:DNA internalization-related competence protein ComEC/Rec2 [Gammaproteobacteria bacterium]MCP4088773.1 DNA internalization-related competence protein ComEC/Rec2 [Gammaproteobacteria bacterium]MCP4275928.1 DNA internalization-related competence protein ComEC/Rec2 [Gammaproteobacteria bacterium]MCP4832144.1 DNA internalization-related competence protein ComEC/Rec2 [Gammaproteobacteria bacterium]MCP4928255.1 DNA internalization-related competence protein ComEC/Rec2 [Gammaproteobacteria bacterium